MDSALYSGRERRTHMRVRHTIPVPFRLYDPAGKNLTASGHAQTHDLSPAGAQLIYRGPAGFVASIQKRPVRIDCQLTAADRDETWLRGRTVWLRSLTGASEKKSGSAYSLGVQFEPDPHVQSALARLVAQPAVPASTSREQLAALLQISHLLTSSTDLDQVLHTILSTVSRLLDAEGSSLLLLDPLTQELVFQMPFDPEHEQIKTTRLKPGEGIAGWVVKERQPHLCNDVAQEKRFYKKIDDLTGFHTASLLAAPLIDHGRMLGVIEVLNSKRPEGFKQDDIGLLEAFCAHATVALRNAQLVARMAEENEYLQTQVEERYRTLIGNSPRMQEIVRLARKAAASSSTVLLLGESGVGKEVLARSLHAWSPRAAKPFRAVNCAALSEHLLESELFGHEKGAFTGAHQQKKGLFELADGGTVFLDEIGEMRPELQAKLLRVLQDHEFMRVGGTQSLRTDLRVLAATNQELSVAVEEGRFRKDLFYRLNVITLAIPPLRERPEDIPALAAHFLARVTKETHAPPMTLSPEAMQALLQHNWPGNVRELENAIERAVVLTAEPTIQASDIAVEPLASPRDDDDPMDLPYHASMEAHKRALIQHAIRKAGGKTKAALALQLQPTYLSRLCKQLGIP